MNEEPEIAWLADRAYAGIETKATMETLGTAVPPLTSEVFGWLAARGIAPAGAPFWRYTVIDMAGEIELISGVPVETTVSGDGRVAGGILPAGRYARVRHTGHPATLADATGRLLDWGAAQGLKWDMSAAGAGEPSTSEPSTSEHWGCRLEFYLTDPADEPDMSKWVTELAFRLAD
jgi:effector-binding domain-containing protein